jgi:hypothetical protein
MTGSKKIKKIEELLKELPSPLDDWALSQVDKSCEGWRDKCENLIWAVGSFAQWHKTKEGVDFWYDVLERAGNNTIHEHPDVVAWNERPKLNPEYHDEGKRKTITNQEKDLQMDGKQEKQFPYKAMWFVGEVEVLAEHNGKVWFRDDFKNNWVRPVEVLQPLPQKPLEFGEWWENEYVEDFTNGYASVTVAELNLMYYEYQDYLKDFEK